MPSTSYTVAITAITKSAPADGFVDPFRVEDYFMKGEGSPSTLETSTTKERANIRWKAIISKLQTLGNIYITPSSITAPGGDPDTAPTSVAFTLVVEHGEASLHTDDETNPGTFLKGAAAIERAIARALVREHVTRGDVYDPTLTTTKGDETERVRFGNRIFEMTVGALAADITEAEAVITVTKV